MGEILIAFHDKSEMTDASLQRALNKGSIQRLDVTRDDVLAKMSKQDRQDGILLHELSYRLMTSEKREQREALQDKLSKNGYYKRYQEILESIPVDFNQLRCILITEHEIRSIPNEHWEPEYDEEGYLINKDISQYPIVGYGHLKMRDYFMDDKNLIPINNWEKNN